jgi:phosphohistidine phosphatase
MRLYIVRHGEAEIATAAGDDAARHLTERGKRRLAEAASGMQNLGLALDAILTSPLARAVETAQIISAAYKHHPRPRMVTALAGGATPSQAIAALAPFDHHESVMIVGHEPQLTAITSMLLTGAADRIRLQLKKGGCIALQFAGSTVQGQAELIWMMTQRQLRKIGKRAK